MIDDIFIDGSSYDYTRLDAILWKVDGPNINYRLSQRHFEYIKNFLNDTSKHLVIRCNDSVEFEENGFMNSIHSRLNVDTRPIILTDINHTESKKILEILKNHTEVSTNFSNNNNISKLLIYGKNKEEPDISYTHESLLNLEDNYIKDIISNSFIKEKKTLVSTTITATGEFDAFKIISSPKYFIWVSIKLADMVKDYKEKNPDNNYAILSVSLRGSILGGAVAGLCNLSINTIDHLGPKYKVIDLEFTETLRGKKYIYIGDFVIGGTEIKIAQAYTKIFGGEFVNAFAIGSMLSNHSYEDSFKLKTLYVLKDIREDLKYTIENV